MKDFIARSLFVQFHRHRFRVAVNYRNACRRRADLGRERLNHSVLETPKNLARFRFDLLLFSLDVRNYVRTGIQRRHSRISRAGKRLQRGNKHSFWIKWPQRGECHHKKNSRTIWVGYDRAFPTLLLLLKRKQIQMIGIHFWNQKWHERIHAMISRIAHYHMPCGREFGFYLSRDRRIQRRKNQLWP